MKNSDSSEKRADSERNQAVSGNPYLKIAVRLALLVPLAVLVFFSIPLVPLGTFLATLYALALVAAPLEGYIALKLRQVSHPVFIGAVIGNLAQALFTQNKMRDLGQKGVEARAIKAEQNAQLEMVAAVDPLKGMLVPLVEDMIEGSESIPRAVRGVLAKNAATLISSSQVNFTGWVLQALDSKFPQLQLQSKLNALGVITNAEKVAS